MERAGYLEPHPAPTVSRNARFREHDHGGSGSSFDDVVRAYEDAG
jgi:hypothetical protein